MRDRKLLRRGWVRKGQGGEAGQALVEAALTLPILLVILVGAVEFGRMAYAAIEVSNAASAAAQYGAQTHATAGDTAGMTTAAQNEYTIAPTSLSLTVSPQTCTCSNSTSGATVSCHDSTVCPGAQIELTITVKTQATFDPLIHLAFLPKTITLHGQAIQKVLQ